jgi:hypothetical protein
VTLFERLVADGRAALPVPRPGRGYVA